MLQETLMVTFIAKWFTVCVYTSGQMMRLAYCDAIYPFCPILLI